MQSVMSNLFSQVPSTPKQRSSFNRRHGVKTTFDADYLVPIFVDEVIPGDTYNLKMDAFGRLATPVAPIMDNMYLDSFFFFVPYRLVWDNWQKFMGERIDPDDSIDYIIPTWSVSGDYSGASMSNSVWNYFGLPLVNYSTATDLPRINALPLRAYHLIWNEWFRDENLQDQYSVPKDDGPDTSSDYIAGASSRDIKSSPLVRGKRHDYFTSCLPFLQKGDAVELPLGTTAPIESTGAPSFNNAAGSETETYFTTGFSGVDVHVTTAFGGGDQTMYWDDPALEVNLASATAATIAQLREAMQIQMLLETDARGGTRYIEIIKSHFGVTPQDFRLQRPEFLGGGSTPININPIAKTANDSSESTTGYVGDLGAMGTYSLNNHGFNKSFDEHGVIIGMVNVRGDLNYFQGIERMWSRETRYDYPWPELMNIGDQAVLNKEIYSDGSSDDLEVFGYQERYGDFKYKPSRVTGLFNPDLTAAIDQWHFAQNFTTRPDLDSDFIEANLAVNLDRCINVPSQPQFLFDAVINLNCARMMPLYSVPGGIFSRF
jgi:hypothetical protein